MPKHLHPNLQPVSADSALKGALVAFEAGRLKEAGRLAGLALASRADDVLAAQVLAHSYLQWGRGAEAIEPLQTTARHTKDPTIETLLARALASAGRSVEAIAQLRETTARLPPFALAFLELADQLTAAGRFDEGVTVFEQGMALTNATVLRVGLGYLHLRRNDRAKARDLFLEARATEPQRRDVLIALAKVSALEGDHAVAIDLYQAALELRPEDHLTRIELGKSQLELGERELGEASLRLAARSGGPLAGLAINALATASRGRLFLRRSAAEDFLGGAAL
jgi:tetratricopeptide (TPR) repeat protein